MYISNLGPNSLTSALANVRLDRPGNRTSESLLMVTLMISVCLERPTSIDMVGQTIE